MFFYHTLRPLSVPEEIVILEALIADKLPTPMHPIMKLAQYLRKSSDPTLGSLAPSLSTRQLLRLAKRLKVGFSLDFLIMRWANRLLRINCLTGISK